MTALPRRAAPAVVAVVLLALVLFVLRLGATPLVDPDEARYAAAARAMAETGDFVVPRFHGEVRLNKPPLAYWLQAAAMGVLGPTEAAARAPSALAALVAVGALLLAGMRSAGPRAGVTAALVLATSPLAFVAFHLATTDGLVTTLLALSLLAVLGAREGRLAPWPATLLGGTALGLAVLAKGHVPLVLFLAVEILFAALRGRVPRPRPALLLAGAALVALIVLPWLLAVAARLGWGPLLETVAGELGRITGGSDHPEPWHYHLLRYPVYVFPWTGLVATAALAAFRRRREDGDAFLLAWALAPLVVFSLSAGKNDLYLLPALPGAALLTGRVWGGPGAGARLGSARRLLPAAAISGLIAAAGAVFLLEHPSSRDWFRDRLGPTLAATALLVLLPVVLAALGRGRGMIGAMTALMAALYLAGLTVVPGEMESHRSTRDLARAFRAEAGPADAIAFFRAEAVKHPSLVFYLDGRRSVPSLVRTRELREARRQPGRLFIVTGEDNVADLARHERRWWRGPLAGTPNLSLFVEREDAGALRPGPAGPGRPAGQGPDGR